jgi:hypothetical protein
MPSKLVDLLMDLHTGTQAALRLGTLTGEPFPITAGVKQGCVIAPLLFNVYIDFVVRQALARMPACGVLVRFGFNGSPSRFGPDSGCPTIDELPLLMYADDMGLTCPSAVELVQFLRCMDDVRAEAGLCINASKTEIMSVDRRGRDPLPAPIALRGGAVKQVDKFKYLGSMVTGDCTFDAEISALIGKAAGAFHALRHVWTAPPAKFSVGLKAVVYKACVRRAPRPQATDPRAPRPRAGDPGAPPGHPAWLYRLTFAACLPAHTAPPRPRARLCGARILRVARILALALRHCQRDRVQTARAPAAPAAALTTPRAPAAPAAGPTTPCQRGGG